MPRSRSYHIGHIKTVRILVDRFAEMVGSHPSRILFLDDNLINVDGATAAGFAAFHVRGVTEAERALEAAGVLDVSRGPA